MKTTTIHIDVEEHVNHLEIRSWVRGRIRQDHIEALRMLTNRDAATIGVNEAINPPKEWSPEWENEALERFARVWRNRKVKTVVIPTRVSPTGLEFAWKVTVFWKKPKMSLIGRIWDAPGYWKMFRISKGGQRRLVCTIDAPLDCCGDDLYENLPVGEDPDSFDVEAEPGTVVLLPRQESHGYEFRFHRTRNQRRTK